MKKITVQIEKRESECKFEEIMNYDGSWQKAELDPSEYLKVLEIEFNSNEFRYYLATDNGTSFTLYRERQ